MLLFRYSNKVTHNALHYHARSLNAYMYIAARTKDTRFIRAVCGLKGTHNVVIPTRGHILKRICQNGDHVTLDTLLSTWTDDSFDTVKLLRYFGSYGGIKCIRVFVKYHDHHALSYAINRIWNVNTDLITALLESYKNTILTPEYAENIIEMHKDFSHDRLTTYVLISIHINHGQRFQEYLCKNDIDSLIASGVPLSKFVLQYAVTTKRINIVRTYLNRASDNSTDVLSHAFTNAVQHTDPHIALLILTYIHDRVSIVSVAQYTQSAETLLAVLKKWLYTKDELNEALYAAAENVNFYTMQTLIDRADPETLSGKYYNLVRCVIENRRLAIENHRLSYENQELRRRL